MGSNLHAIKTCVMTWAIVQTRYVFTVMTWAVVQTRYVFTVMTWAVVQTRYAFYMKPNGLIICLLDNPHINPALRSVYSHMIYCVYLSQI